MSAVIAEVSDKKVTMEAKPVGTRPMFVVGSETCNKEEPVVQRICATADEAAKFIEELGGDVMKDDDEVVEQLPPDTDGEIVGTYSVTREKYNAAIENGRLWRTSSHGHDNCAAMLYIIYATTGSLTGVWRTLSELNV